MVIFLFSVHTVTEAKPVPASSLDTTVDLPGRSSDMARPGVAPSLFTPPRALDRAALTQIPELFEGQLRGADRNGEREGRKGREEM